MTSTRIRWAAVFALALLAVAVGCFFYFRHGAGQQNEPARGAPVGAVAARLADVPVFIDALGTVTPTRTITVMTQVNGILSAVEFREGQRVKRGQVIARIDSRALEAQLAQARGELIRDQATLANSRLDLQRYRDLIKAGSITRQTLDTQIAAVRQNEGTVQADKGNVRNLEVQVDYCTITSPVDGVVGLRLVDPGNYVTTSSTTGIAVITQLEPATVVFAVPEDYLGQIHRAMARGPVPVFAYDRDNRAQLARGALLALDNQVDTTTGTVKVKAQFEHAGHALFPNQFVNARLLADTLRQVPLIPTAAIQHGSNGDFVFIVGADDKVELRTVKTGPPSGTDTAILDGGIQSGERVVTDGADKLDNGALVRATSP